MKKSVFVSIVLVGLLLLASCGDKVSYEPKKSIGIQIDQLLNTETLSLVYYVDFNELHKSGIFDWLIDFLDEMMKHYPLDEPINIRDTLEKETEKLQIDLTNDIAEIIFIMQLDDSPTITVMANGNFANNQKLIIDRIKEESEDFFTVNNEKGIDIYTGDTKNNEKTSFAFLNNELFIVSNHENRISQISDMVNGKTEQREVDERIKKVLSMSRFDTTGWGIIYIPEKLSYEMENNEYLSMYKFFSDVDCVYFNLELNDKNSSSLARLYLRKSDKIDQVAQFIEGYMKVQEASYSQYFDMKKYSDQSNIKTDKKNGTIEISYKFDLQEYLDDLKKMMNLFIEQMKSGEMYKY